MIQENIPGFCCYHTPSLPLDAYTVTPKEPPELQEGIVLDATVNSDGTSPIEVAFADTSLSLYYETHTYHSNDHLCLSHMPIQNHTDLGPPSYKYFGLIIITTYQQ